MEKAKITNHQLFCLTANFTCGSSIIIASASIAKDAKQDAWISALIVPFIGLILLGINFYLTYLYPGKSYVQIIQLVFGKWIGFLLSLFLLSVALLNIPQVTWYIGNFFTTTIMTETPAYVINLLFIISIVIGLLYGLETIARSSEILLYIMSVIFIISMILVLPNAKMNNLLPILENGIAPILKGANNLSSFATFPLIFMFIIYPVNTYNDKKTRTSLVLGYLWGMFLIFIAIIMCIFVLGSTITSRSLFPVYLLAKEINIGTILNRLEILITIIWIITLFYRIVIYFYSLVAIISELLKLSDHKKIIIPLGFLCLILTEIVYPDVVYQINWDEKVWVVYSTAFAVVLPMSILLVSLFKKLFGLNK